MKRISIIIPCFNVEKFIDRCLTSLEMQTIGMDAIEIICVDDSSTDSTLEILHEWEQKYPDLCIVELPDNGRQGRARNIGLQYATCEWIAFIDSDDWIEPDYFEKLYNAAVEFENNNSGKILDLVCCKLRRDSSTELSFFSDEKKNKDANNKLIRVVDLEDNIKKKESLVLATLEFNAYCKLIRREFLIKNGLFFPERLAYEDIFWGSLLPYYANSAIFVNEELYHYFVNPNSTVLVNNADYHTDMLTVNVMLWEEYKKRGLYPEFKDEIEYNYIYTCYLAFLKILALRYEKPQYSLFLLLKELTNERIPDPMKNRYINNGDIKEFHKVLLEMLDKDINKEEFTKVLEMIRIARI